MVKSVYVPRAGGVIDFPDTATPQQMLTYIEKTYGPSTGTGPAPAAAGDDGSGLLSNFAYRLATGITDIPGGIASIVYPAEDADKTTLGSISSESRKYLEQQLGIDPTKERTTGQMLAGGLGSLASLLIPGLGVAKGLGMAGAGARLATRGAALTASTQGAALGAEGRSEQIRAQLEGGMDITPEQQLAAQQGSALVGTLEGLPLGRVFGPLTTILSKVPVSKAPIVEKIITNRLSRVIGTGSAEGAQEAVSGIANDLVEYGVYNPDVEIGQDILSNAGTGAFAGSVLESVIQIAAGRKLRASRQLREDIASEARQNTSLLEQGEITKAAESLRQFNVEGPVSVSEEEIEGGTGYTIKTPSGNMFGVFSTPDAARQAVDVYQKRTGAKVTVAEDIPGPSAFPVKINNKVFNSIDEVAAERDAVKARRDSIASLGTNPELIKLKAQKQGGSETFYKSLVEKDVIKQDALLGRLNNFIDAAEGKAKLAPDTETSAQEEEVEAPKDIEDFEGVDLNEPVAEEPSVELPIEESRFIEETPPAETLSEAEPIRTELRPSADPDQLDALKMEMFGKSMSVRDMTPEQRTAYDAERDKRFPPVETPVYYDAGAATAPRTISQIQTQPNPREFAPEYKAAQDQLYTELVSRAKNIVPSDVGVRLKAFVEERPGLMIKGAATKDGTQTFVEFATGYFRPDMDVESMLKDLVATLNHEAIHVLREGGFFRPAEWRMLSRAAQNTKLPGKKYTYLDKAEAIYGSMGGVYSDPDAIIEEAVAEMYKDWVSAKNTKEARPVGGLFNRLTEFIRSIFRALQNNRYKDVFKRIESGEVKGRAPSPMGREGKRFAVDPAFLRSASRYTEEIAPGSRKKEYYITDAMDASKADKAFRRLDETARRYPDPLSSGATWTNTLAYAFNQQNDLLMPPGWGISMSNDINSWAKWMKGLTPDQLNGVDGGFASIDQIASEYKSGRTTPEFTGTLLFWTYLSRMASSFPHESGFLDAAEGATAFINKAVNGTFTANQDLLSMTSTGEAAKLAKYYNGFPENSLPADIAVAGRSDLDDWFLFIRKIVPKDSPGNSVTNNMNSFGRDFLFNMSSPAPGRDISKLRAVHEAFAGNGNGPDVRREFHRIRDGASLGFDNKILSFAILLSGRKDVLVLDRIQINQLFGGGQTNKIYDDVQGMFNGPKGLAVYEALERGLGQKVNDLYAAVGRPNDASLGRYHWESWIRSSGQIVAHPTIQGLVNMSRGVKDPLAGIGSAEGRYHRSMFGVQYVRMPSGKSEFVYTTVDGREFSIAKEKLDTILSKDNLLRIGAIPKWFPGVSDFEGGVVSWKDYPGVDINKVDTEISRNGVLVGNGRSNQTLSQDVIAAQAANAARIARARTAHDASNRARYEFGRRPVGGKPTDRIPESYRTADRRPSAGNVKEVFTPKDGVKDIFERSNISSPDFLELATNEENVSRFRDALIASKEESTHGAAVYVYGVNDYAGMRLFITEDNGAGFALKPDGDIVSVFNRKSSPYRAVSIPIIHLAVQLGGRKLDGFDTVLPSLYTQGGMTVVSRTKFSDLDGIKPDNWDYNTFAAFNGGRPDVVFMVFSPSNWSLYKPTDGQLMTSNKRDPYQSAEEAYNAATRLQNKFVYKEPESKVKAGKEPKKRFSAAPALTSSERAPLLERRKTLLAESRSLVDKVRLSGSEAERLIKIGNDINDITYKLMSGRPLDPAKVKSESERMSVLPKDIVVQAYDDALKDYDVFMAINNAAMGTVNDSYTDVDRLVEGPKASTMYEVFSPTREALRSAFGDTMRLYRAQGRQRQKPTQNWATTREYAQQFGDNVVERDIPVANILAVNVATGNYHEVIVGEPPRTEARFSAAPLPTYIESRNDTLFAPAPKEGFFAAFSNFFMPNRDQPKTLNTIYGPVDMTAREMRKLRRRVDWVDSGAALAELEKLANLKSTGNYERMMADDSATVALGMRRRSTQIGAAMYMRGKLALDYARPGDIQSATMKVIDDPDTMVNIIKVLMEPGPADSRTGEVKDKREVFKSYATAMRAKNKKAMGIRTPNEVDDTYINTVIPFTEREYPEVVEAYKMYQRFNRNLLKTAKEAGLMDDPTYQRLTRDMDYYGFYREVFENVLAPGIPTKTASKFELRAMKGGEHGNMVNDPVYVMVHNAQFWVDAIAKNLAAQKSFKLARDMGVARILASTEKPDPTRDEQEQVMFFRENGVQKRFAVSDPLLVSALGGDDRVDVGRFWQIVGMPTTILRETVTRDPGFMIANLLRDTLSAWITSGEDITPFIGTAKGMAKALKKNASFQALMGRGVVGSYDLAMKGPQELAQELRNRATPRNIMTLNGPEAATAVLGGLWNRLGALSEASDAATRIAVYEAARAKGLSEAEATFRAIEILDFSRRGGSQALSILTKVIPFLNARIQGMDVLYQAGKAAGKVLTGQAQGERETNLGKKFLVRGAMLAAISVALEMMNDDDEDYQQLDDYIKNGNLLIPLKFFGFDGGYIAIPKPFEAGLLFSTFPQQFYKTLSGDASMRENVKLFTSSLASTFGVNPIPQAILPIMEVITNHDFYTGLPLIPEGKARLSPELQYNSRTSQLAMMLGQVPIVYDMNSGRFEGMSPIVIDTLISGYGGPFGAMFAQAIGLAMEGANVGPERLPRNITELPVVRRFFMDAEAKNPKVVTQAYELFRIMDEANRSFSRLRQTGDAEATLDYLNENKDILTYKKYIFKLVDRLNKLSAHERAIERDTTMSREEKLEAMARLRETRIRLASKVGEISEAIGR